MKIKISNQGIDMCVSDLFLLELASYILKCKLNTWNMQSCDQKLFYSCMCSNACMLGVKACMHVARVLYIRIIYLTFIVCS